MLNMLHWLYTYVVSVCFKCFICFKRILQVFYLDVAYVAMLIHIYCKRIIVKISSVLNVCCNKCFMLQVFHEQARQEGAGEGGPLGHSGSRMCAGSEASAEHKALSMGMAADAEHEAASMDRQ
jgi:hypothetical protein